MTQLRHTDWPDRLWIVRHGQSAGNVARDTAETQGLDLINVPQPVTLTHRYRTSAMSRCDALARLVRREDASRAAKQVHVLALRTCPTDVHHSDNGARHRYR